MHLPTSTLRVATPAVAALAALGLAACGSSGGSSSSGTSASGGSGGGSAYGAASKPKTTASAPAAAGAGAKLMLSADPGGALMFNTTKLSAKAGSVTVEMKNPSGSGVPHAIAITGNGVDQTGQTANPGGTSTVTAKLKPGTYTFFCPIPGHEAGGMKGTLTVT
jgi:plastocyanin